MSSVTISLAQIVSSSVITIRKFSGRSFLNSTNFALIAFEASIALALSLSVNSKVTASSPLTLAYEVKSLKVLLISAISPRVTMASLVTLIGME